MNCTGKTKDATNEAVTSRSNLHLAVWVQLVLKERSSLTEE